MTSLEAETTTIIPPTEDLPSRFFVPHHVQLAVTFGALSEVGNVRASNEDHYVVMRRSRTQEVVLTNEALEDLPPVHEEAHVMVVADGMGGAAFGELASNLVVRTAWELTMRATKWIMKMNEAEAREIQDRYNAYAQVMQHTLIKRAETEPKLAGMGTTWTSASMTGADAVIAHVGDSRAYLFHRGSVKQITRDHTVAQRMIDAGCDPASAHPFRHVLTNCFGGCSDEVRVDTYHVELEAGDHLMLCTDGLSDEVSQEEMLEIIGSSSDPQQACQRMVDLVLSRDAKDNTTVVLARCAEL